MGEVIKDEDDKPPEQNPDGTVPADWKPILPFTEAEERKRDELTEKYKKEPLGLHIDSIEPEGGPMTGTTRVLVRGGPFKDMGLIHPYPKCKFGRKDKIVSATYV